MTGSKTQAGFTLVEVMIVVTMIGILSALAIPSFKKLLPRIKLSNNASKLANEIAGLRMQAIAQSKQFRVVFDVPGGHYHLEKEKGAGFDRYSSMSLTGSVLVSAVIDPTDPSPEVLVVKGVGGTNVPLGGKGVIVLQTPSGDLQKQVLVETTGRVSLQKRKSDGTWVNE